MVSAPSTACNVFVFLSFTSEEQTRRTSGTDLLEVTMCPLDRVSQPLFPSFLQGGVSYSVVCHFSVFRSTKKDDHPQLLKI